MTTAQMSLVSVTVDGKPLGTFQTRTGGEVTAEPAKYRPGGMAAQRSTAALPEYGDVTVSRVFERERGDHDIIRALTPRVGRALMSVSETALDDDGVPNGKPTVWTGRLAGITPGDVDSESVDPRSFELMMIVTSKA